MTNGQNLKEAIQMLQILYVFLDTNLKNTTINDYVSVILDKLKSVRGEAE